MGCRRKAGIDGDKPGVAVSGEDDFTIEEEPGEEWERID